MLKTMNIKKYRVLVGYVSYTGQTIQPGEYTSLEIDEAEARNKSLIVCISSNINAKVTKEHKDNQIQNKQPVSNYREEGEVKTLTLQPVITHSEVKLIKINSVDKKELVALKFVGEKTADLVIEERKLKPFNSYEELNTRVPLRGKHNWEDIAILDFEIKPDPINHLVTIINDSR